MPKLNRQNTFAQLTFQPHVLTVLSSSTPSYSFHGSNSSHSKDSGQGGRTYHVPNYATSYANEKSHLISVTFDEDKGAKKTIVAIVFMFLLLLGFSAPFIIQILDRGSICSQNQGAVALYKDRQETNESSSSRRGGTQLSVAGPTEVSGPGDHGTGSGDGVALGKRIGHTDGNVASSGLYWDDLQVSRHCSAYGTRRYTARLRNVPFWANRTRACMETPVQINGETLFPPDKCEINWPFGAVKGHWNVSVKGSDCSPVWGKFTDKGCVMPKGSHRRLFRSRLWNIKKGEDGLLLCKTAPASMMSIYRTTPDSCKDKSIWGIYGEWTVEDMKC